MALLLVAIFRRRQPGAAEGGFFSGTTFVALAGAVIPFVVLMVVFGVTLRALIALAEPNEPAPLTIDVVGHQFWWDVRYPNEGVVTANEIHIPTDQPVTLNLTGGDVIHSFWVPQLAGKMDLIPGKTSTIWLQADEPGEYRGQCAEFCGIQHAHMAFLVIAQPQDEFAAWLDRQRQPSSEPAPDSLVERGEQIFLGSACVYCHAVRGTEASGELGPDLTHLASRRTLAAGTLENNLGNLAGWISDPQSIKPGNAMPATNLGSEELQALLAYLMSLE
jgi:cytochrome c oxidase subunit 2